MKLIAFQPSSKWDSLKRNAILMVTLGIVIVFGVLLFVIPISSMRSISSAGRKMSSLLQRTVNSGVKTTSQVLKITSDTIKTAGDVATDGMTKIAEKTEGMIEFMTEIIQDIHKAYGKSVKFTINSTKQLVEAVSKTSEFVIMSLSKSTRMIVETSQKAFESTMKTIWKTQEMMSDAIEYCFVPALENFLKVTYDMAKIGVNVYQKYLPKVIRYMYFFGKFSVTISAGQAAGQVFMAFVSMVSYLFSNAIDIGSSILGRVITGIGTAIKEVIPAFIERIQNFLGNVCEPIVNLVNGILEFFPSLPFGLDFDDCSTEFITMALKLMTKGSICGGEKYPDTVSKFAGCIFSKIENITLFPGFSTRIGPFTMLDLMGLDVRGIPFFGDLLRKIPSIPITIPRFTIGSIFGSLVEVILSLAGRIETFIFAEMDRYKKSVVSVVSRPGTAFTLPNMILQLFVRVVREAATLLGQFITGIINAIPICDLFDVCFDFNLCERLCSVVEFFGIKCNLSCSAGTVCLLRELGIGCNYLKNLLTTAINGLLGFATSFIDPLLDLILGSFKSIGTGSW